MARNLVDELTREHRYRRVLLVAAVIGIVASCALAAAFALGAVASSLAVREPADALFFALPFAASMTVGTTIHRVLCWRGLPRAR